MIHASVMYPSGEGKTFDYAYYRDTHMKTVRERLGPLGLMRLEIDRGLAGGAPGAPAPFACMGHLYFNTLEEYQKAMKAHGRELMADVPNFTNITPQIQISEVIG